MSEAKEYYIQSKNNLFNDKAKTIKKANHKTIEDVKEVINRLKESGYDEIPENWYVDGKELLIEIEKRKI